MRYAAAVLPARSAIALLALGSLALLACERARDVAPVAKASVSAAPAQALVAAPSASVRAVPSLDADEICRGYMSGHCAAHRARIDAVPRNARRRAAVSEMPTAQVATLDKAATHYFRTRSDHEIDLSGTMRAVYGIEEQARLEEQLVRALEQLRDPTFPGAVGDAVALEGEIRVMLGRIATCKSYAEMENLGLAGAVTRAGIRRTHDAWLPYRSAFVALTLAVRPESKPEVWRAWLSADRLQLLQELARGC